MSMKSKMSDDDRLKVANSWLWEASWASRGWREESWRDCEIYDGGDSAWSQEDWDRAVNAGIDPLTINRIFPAAQKLLGSQIVNRFEMIAKARTQKDGEISKTMSEGIKFVMDQYEGEFILSQAYFDQLIPGIGCISPCFNHDPRKERVALKYRKWTEIGWDPYSPPWWSPEKTRYVYWNPWVDLEDFVALFPKKEREIREIYDEMRGNYREGPNYGWQDEAELIEENVRTLASTEWIEESRKRIRPVQMWYPVNEMGRFALFSDGRCIEIRKETPPLEAFEIVRQSQRVIPAIVKKMRTMTFFGQHLLLQDDYSPYQHDLYPFVPFVGYIDRYGFPYGAPRQARGPAEEVSKRRSMALAMLQKRRVMIEKDAVMNGDKDSLDTVYEEVNKLDGFTVLESGGLGKIEVEELAQLSQYQLGLLNQSEYEIRDIMGADNPLFAGEQSQSGVAKQADAEKSAITTASLPDNLRRSMSLLGYQVMANIQQAWKFEKVLRVTDRLTGAERFITVNQPIQGMGGEIVVKNRIDQGKFDMVISEVPATDTMREKNLDILYAAIEKSPPQAVPTLLLAAFEMSDLPNKEALIEKLKPILGLDPSEESQDPEQVKQKVMQEIQAQRQTQKMQSDMMMEEAKLKLNEMRLKNMELEAKIAKLMADTEKTEVETEIAANEHQIEQDRAVIEGVERGIGIQERLDPENKNKETTEATQ